MPLVLVSEFLERLDRDEAKTRLVNYCFMVRDTLQDSKLEQRYKAAQQEKIEFCLQSTLELLSSPSSVFATAEDLWGDEEGAGRSPGPVYAGGLRSSRCRWGARGRDA